VIEHKQGIFHMAKFTLTIEFANHEDLVKYVETGKAPLPMSVPFVAKSTTLAPNPELENQIAEFEAAVPAEPQPVKKRTYVKKDKFTSTLISHTELPKGEVMEDSPIPYAKVQDATMAFHGRFGRDKLIAALAEFGADHAKKLKPQQYKEYLERLATLSVERL
jgi:hypothetical protein